MLCDLLAAHRAEPTRESTRELAAWLRPEAKAIIKAHPPKSLPAWISHKALRDDVEAALTVAVRKLAHVPVDEQDVSAFVRAEIEAQIAPLFEVAPADFINRLRGHSLKRGRKRDGVCDAVDSEREPDFRDHVQQTLDEMFHTAKTEKQEVLIALFSTGAPLRAIREQTGLRGPDILRTLFGLKSA